MDGIVQIAMDFWHLSTCVHPLSSHSNTGGDPRCPLTCIYPQVSQVPSCTTDGCVTVLPGDALCCLSILSVPLLTQVRQLSKNYFSTSRLQSVRVKLEEVLSLNWLYILDTGLRPSTNKVYPTKHW